MFIRSLFSAIPFLLILAFNLPAQEVSNKTEGLELPANQIINADEGFVNVQAKCKGAVRWLVSSSEKVKQLVNQSTNSITVSVPPQGGIITVYAVALTEDKKLTEFVSCNIVVRALSQESPSNQPTEPQRESSNKPQEPLHVTFVLDFNSVSGSLPKLLSSPSLKRIITERGCYFRVLDLKSPVVSSKKLDVLYNKVGGPSLIVQKADGSLAVPVINIPRTEKDILDHIFSLRK